MWNLARPTTGKGPLRFPSRPVSSPAAAGRSSLLPTLAPPLRAVLSRTHGKPAMTEQISEAQQAGASPRKGLQTLGSPDSEAGGFLREDQEEMSTKTTSAKGAKTKRKARKERPSRAEIQAKALQNALSHESLMNYETIIEGFAEKGIDPDDIEPRVNVFTFNAWLALGRAVRKGETGVKVVTYIERKNKDGAAEGQAPSALDIAIAAQEGHAKPRLLPRTTTVFHISQTDPVTPREQAAQPVATDAAQILASTAATGHDHAPELVEDAEEEEADA